MVGRGVLVGVLVAAGGLMLVPGVAAAVARAGRPAIRAAIRGGATAVIEARRAGAEAYEHLEDLGAEVRAEMAGAVEDREEEEEGEPKSKPRGSRSRVARSGKG